MFTHISKQLALLTVALFFVVGGAIPIDSSLANMISAYKELQPNNANDFVRLIDLLPGGDYPGIVVGDKHFSSFSYGTLGDIPDATQVNVFGIQIDGHYGVRFQVNYFDLVEPNIPPRSSDALIGFDVSVEDPERYLISDVHLFGNPAVSGPNNGQFFNAFAEVVETVSGEFGSRQLSIHDDFNGFVGEAWIDPLPFPVPALRVTKDIQLLSLLEGEVLRRATISQIDQTFSQVVVGVPEPTTVCLSAFAAIWIVCGHRRKQT